MSGQALLARQVKQFAVRLEDFLRCKQLRESYDVAERLPRVKPERLWGESFECPISHERLIQYRAEIYQLGQEIANQLVIAGKDARPVLRAADAIGNEQAWEILNPQLRELAIALATVQQATSAPNAATAQKCDNSETPNGQTDNQTDNPARDNGHHVVRWV